jgi:hypothetical protein
LAFVHVVNYWGLPYLFESDMTFDRHTFLKT